MISDQNYKEAFVWIWLPEETSPVVAGKLEIDNRNILFNYGRSYLERIAGLTRRYEWQLCKLDFLSFQYTHNGSGRSL